MYDEVKDAIYKVVLENCYYNTMVLNYPVEQVEVAIEFLGMSPYIVAEHEYCSECGADTNKTVIGARMEYGFWYLEDCTTPDQIENCINWYRAECNIRDWNDERYKVEPKLRFMPMDGRIHN